MLSTSISLLDRLQKSGDSQAWNRFVELYTPLIHHSVRRTGLPTAEVSDLVQDVFLLLLRKLPAFEYERSGSFRAWLTVLTRNRCLDHLRRRHTVQNGSNGDVAISDDTELFTDEEYRRFVTRRALQLMQTEFEEKTWRACWENVVSGRSAEEVAEELGMSTNAVYIARSRVLRRLREELSNLLD